jgi:hypothetical protein
MTNRAGAAPGRATGVTPPRRDPAACAFDLGRDPRATWDEKTPAKSGYAPTRPATQRRPGPRPQRPSQRPSPDPATPEKAPVSPQNVPLSAVGNSSGSRRGSIAWQPERGAVPAAPEPSPPGDAGFTAREPEFFRGFFSAGVFTGACTGVVPGGRGGAAAAAPGQGGRQPNCKALQLPRTSGAGAPPRRAAARPVRRGATAVTAVTTVTRSSSVRAVDQS